jgi:hypothetical protein
MNSVKRVFAAGIVGAALAVSMVGGAAAFHPGNADGSPPEVPQGPNLVACLNQGGAENPNGMGVINAIERGGQVHCRPDGED